MIEHIGSFCGGFILGIFFIVSVSLGPPTYEEEINELEAKVRIQELKKQLEE